MGIGRTFRPDVEQRRGFFLSIFLRQTAPNASRYRPRFRHPSAASLRHPVGWDRLGSRGGSIP